MSERDNHDHPNNAAALWHLLHRTGKVAADGSLIIEDKKKREINPEDYCPAAAREESAAFVRSLWGAWNGGAE